MLPPGDPGWRGGRLKLSSSASVLRSSSFSVGPESPTHTVTIRSRESKVTEAQSAE
jgi:hypothetical protein